MIGQVTQSFVMWRSLFHILNRLLKSIGRFLAKWLRSLSAETSKRQLPVREQEPLLWQPPLIDPDLPPEVCVCVCHWNLGVVHVTPCCAPCERCGLRIRQDAKTEHRLRCKQQPQ